MEKVGNLLNQNSQTKPSLPSTPNYAHSEKVFDYVWRGLQAGRLLTMDLKINGTDYRYWRENLKDLTDNQLKAGLKDSGSVHEFFTWAVMRKLCIEAHMAQTEQNWRRINTTARLNRPETMGNKRFSELVRGVTNIMDDVWQVKRASQEGQLTLRVIKGKTPEQIITYCKGLYKKQEQRL